MAKSRDILTTDMFANFFNDASTFETVDQDKTGGDPNSNRPKNKPVKWLQDIVDNDYLDWIKRRLIAGEPLRQIDYQLCQCEHICLDEYGVLHYE